ncbi:MAG TPA: MFS transporter [Thermoplasmata archaeon]|nr:MFS transporter [Thermoplasmata archaeon]
MAQGNGSKWFYSYLPQGIAGGATSPLIPLFAYALGASLGDVGIIAAATSIASVPAFILWGSLSDRLKARKAFLILGFLGNAISFLAMAVCFNLPEFYLANLLIGFLGAASAPVGAVLVMETTAHDQWPNRLARMSQLTGVGYIAGLSVGCVWLSLGPAFVSGENAMRGLFVIGAALGLLSGLLAGMWLKEPKTFLDRKSIHLVDNLFRIERVKFLPMRMLHYLDFRNHRTARFSPSLRIYLVCVLLLFGGFTAFYGFFPILLQQVYGFSNPEVFAVYIASQAASVTAYLRVGRWVRDRGGRRTQMYASLGRTILFPAFLAIGFLSLSPAAILVGILLLHAGVGLCWALINVSGSTFVSGLAPDDAHAEAMGAYNAVQGFGSILGPLLGGFVAEFYGYAPAIGVSVAFILGGVTILAVTRSLEV